MKKRIVIIDDDRLILTIASDFLSHAGFLVETSACGLKSNDLIYTNPPPDLILIDVMMPLMSGDQKLRSLKANRKSRDIPIVLMSGKSVDELENLADNCGADGYLTKPFTALSLVNTARKYL